MALSRGVRRDLAKARNIIMICGALISVVTFFILRAVLAVSYFNIPVEIIWNDNNNADQTRPNSVIVRLYRQGGTAQIASVTMTQASNADPNDSNRWTYTFNNIQYTSGYRYYVYQEENFNGYQIGQRVDLNVTNATTIDSFQEGDSTVNSRGDHTLGNISYFIYKKGSSWYLWTRYSLNSTELTSFTQAISSQIGQTISVSSSNYMYGSTPYDDNITISGGTTSNVTVKVKGSLDESYYGTYHSASSTSATFNNTLENQECTLTVHHVNEDGTEFAADSTTVYTCGDTYTASPAPADHYEYSYDVTGPAPTGTITSDIDFTYVYTQVEWPVIYAFQSPFPQNAGDYLPDPRIAYYHEGDTVTVAPYPTPPQGWRFVKWHIQNGDDILPGGTFQMPTENVTVMGFWQQFSGYFAPQIEIEIENEPEYYRVFDIVTFAIHVTNPESYDITNVVIQNSLSGSGFIASQDYTVNAATRATIPTIPAGDTVTLYATYQIPTDTTQTITNTATVTSASAANYYYLDDTQTISASTDFNVRSWQDDPVATGVNSNGTTLYVILLLGGAAGAILSVVMSKNNEERKR